MQNMRTAKTHLELGPLQRQVMDFVWAHPGCTVRECRDELAQGGKDHAYTTIQTVFDALHRKRLLSRRRIKNAFHYTPLRTRQNLLNVMFRELLARLGMSQQPVASSLVDALEGGDGDELRALIDELKARGHIN